MLHLYFARRFANTLAAMFGLFFCFLGMIDFIDQLRRYDNDVSFTDVLWLSLLKLPNALYVMLPLIVILAAITLFVALSKSSELIVTRASGRSAIYSLMAPVLVACIMGFFAVAIGNPIVAATSKRYQELSENYRNNGDSTGTNPPTLQATTSRLEPPRIGGRECASMPRRHGSSIT